MDVVSLIIKIVLCLCSLFLIVVVLLQTDENGNANSMISGAQVGRSKARGLDALLSKLTKIAAVVFMVLAAARGIPKLLQFCLPVPESRWRAL